MRATSTMRSACLGMLLLVPPPCGLCGCGDADGNAPDADAREDVDVLEDASPDPGEDAEADPGDAGGEEAEPSFEIDGSRIVDDIEFPLFGESRGV
jgi:hypothetical protein